MWATSLYLFLPQSIVMRSCSAYACTCCWNFNLIICDVEFFFDRILHYIQRLFKYNFYDYIQLPLVLSISAYLCLYREPYALTLCMPAHVEIFFHFYCTLYWNHFQYCMPNWTFSNCNLYNIHVLHFRSMSLPLLRLMRSCSAYACMYCEKFKCSVSHFVFFKCSVSQNRPVSASRVHTKRDLIASDILDIGCQRHTKQTCSYGNRPVSASRGLFIRKET